MQSWSGIAESNFYQSTFSVVYICSCGVVAPWPGAVAPWPGAVAPWPGAVASWPGVVAPNAIYCNQHAPAHSCSISQKIQNSCCEISTHLTRVQTVVVT
jgi:hypothetical protein